ncbi:MAG: hypothetical protein HKN13_01815 [Rhodothermales bacterium]|nr:hypothetical protein [Rhodothermales bacterium]
MDNIPFSDDDLQMWVRIANSTDEPLMGIMLNTAGCTVIGKLCSGKNYYYHVAKELKRLAESGGGEYGYIVYLHIADALVVLPGGLQAQQPYWRGRIDMVSGYSWITSGSVQLKSIGS